MIAMKFGGTSVGTAERLRAACALVKANAHRRPVVVVSAANSSACRMTDTLVDVARMARDWRHANADGQPLDACDSKSALHRFVEEQARRVSGPQLALCESIGVRPPEIDRLLAEFEALVMGVAMIGELSARTLDLVMSFGERMSGPVVAALMAKEFGLDARYRPAYELGLLTDASYGAAVPLEGIEEEIRRRVSAVGGDVVVTTGFVAATADGHITTLGRGGSDYSAALFGAALEAEEIQIWTDVNGVMTTDPRIVPGARTIPELSFREASELAWFGAKVLHPATMVPAIERGIPIRVLSTADADGPSTVVVARPTGACGHAKAIALHAGIDLCTVRTGRMLGATGFAARMFEIFAKHKVDVQMIATSEVAISVTAAASPAMRRAAEELKTLGEVHTRADMALVCVVGEKMAGAKGTARKATGALSDAGVNIVMISQDADEINMSFLVDGADGKAAVTALHGAFFDA